MTVLCNSLELRVCRISILEMSTPLSPQQLGNEPDMVVYQQKEFSTAAFPIMEEIRRQGKLCDITLKVWQTFRPICIDVFNLIFISHRLVGWHMLPSICAYLAFTCFMLEVEDPHENLLFFQVDGHQFTAHRIVLASTIPYFQAMFTSDMLESKKKEINIQGVEPR